MSEIEILKPFYNIKFNSMGRQNNNSKIMEQEDEELKRKYKSNQVIVNNKSNFKSHLVRCQSIMDNNEFDKLIIKAMGKATTRALRLALQLNTNNFNTFSLEPRTYSVAKLEDRARYKKALRGAEKEGFDPDSLDPAVTKKLVHIPAIEVKVLKNKLELGKTRRKRNEQLNG